jgi:hypothetical protein
LPFLFIALDNIQTKSYSNAQGDTNIMKNIKYIPLFTLLLTACGSNFSAATDKIGPDASAGEAGQSPSTAGNAGQDSVSNAGNEAGGADNAGSSGAVNEKAGAAGTENIAGQMNAGGSNNAGSSGSNNAGTGGLSCKPKVTCATYAADHSLSGTQYQQRIACGSIMDDCGNPIQCGGCPDYYGACDSATDTYTHETFTYNKDAIPGIPNICGGGCFLYDNISPYGPGSEYYCYNSPTTLNSLGIPVFDNTKPPPDPSCKNEAPVPSPGGSQMASHTSFTCNSDLFNIGM